MFTKKSIISLVILFFSLNSSAEEMMQAFKKFGIIKPHCSTHSIETNEALANVLTAATCAAYTRLLFLQIPQQSMLKTRLTHQWNTIEKSDLYLTQGRCAVPKTSADSSEYVYENGAKIKLKLQKQSENDGSYLFHGSIGRKSVRVLIKNMPNVIHSCQIGQHIQIKEFRIGSGMFDYFTFPYGASLNFKEFQNSEFEQQLLKNKSISNTSDYEGVLFRMKHHQIQGLSEIMTVWSPQKQSSSVQVHFSNNHEFYFDDNNIDMNNEQIPNEHYFKTIQFRHTQGCSVLTSKNDHVISQFEDCENPNDR